MEKYRLMQPMSWASSFILQQGIEVCSLTTKVRLPRAKNSTILIKNTT